MKGNSLILQNHELAVKVIVFFFFPHFILSTELPVSNLARYCLLPFKTSSAQRPKASESSNR